MVTVLAYAKLNLSLRIRRRRADGFHAIDSIVQTIDLADRLTIFVGSAGLRVESPFPPEEDLTVKAARLILAEKKAKTGVRIRLEKNIPAGAGLGGGSSDAAAATSVLNWLIPPPLPLETLHRLASDLGADVPLFLRGGRLETMGKGERIIPLSSGQERAFLVLIPPLHCATAAVYQKYDELHPKEKAALPRLGVNDLEEAALRLYPALIPYREAINTAGGGYCGMSGSGSTFYAAFKKRDQAQAAAQRLAAAFPEARVEVCAPTESGRKEIG